MSHSEIKFFQSFSVDLECLCVVRKLSFPADGLGGVRPPAELDLRFTAHVFSHGQPLHHVPVSTSACPQQAAPRAARGSGLSLVWDEVISFPVKVRRPPHRWPPPRGLRLSPGGNPARCSSSKHLLLEQQALAWVLASGALWDSGPLFLGGGFAGPSEELSPLLPGVC